MQHQWLKKELQTHQGMIREHGKNSSMILKVCCGLSLVQLVGTRSSLTSIGPVSGHVFFPFVEMAGKNINI